MQMISRSSLMCAALLALAAAPGVNAKTMTPGPFDVTTQQWVQAYNAGNADTIVAMYAEDGIMMPPDAPAKAGHAAMKEFLTSDMAASKEAGLSLSLSDSQEGMSGDMGWHSGKFAVNDKDGKTVMTGKYVEVWKKQNGKWLMIRDIWNNDAPATAAPDAADDADEADEAGESE